MATLSEAKIKELLSEVSLNSNLDRKLLLGILPNIKAKEKNQTMSVDSSLNTIDSN